tara:strand:- start:2206 stop:2403 length:198 start_codon:yes stop_codon:yes gene_type:complete
MKILYKNWFIHNVFGHSISELLYWIIIPFGGATRASRASVWFHDITCPNKGHNYKASKDNNYCGD